MKNIYIRGGMVVVATVMSLAFLVHAAAAQNPDIPKLANSYHVFLARAYDQCQFAEDGPGPSVSVLDVNNNHQPFAGLPATGCLAQNNDTDSQLPMKVARLLVNKRGRIAVFGTGFPFGARIKVELTLRVTRAVDGVLHPKLGTSEVTFEDTTIQCPNTFFGFPVRGSGSLAGTTTLAACLGSNSGLAGGAGARANIEILDAALINVDTGKPLAHPGILR